MLDRIDEISGAKRKQNLTEHADDARISKQLATAKRDIPLELDIARVRRRSRRTARGCARSSGEFELREPLRRLEEALGSADAAAPAPAARARRCRRRVRELPAAELGGALGRRRPRWRSRCARPRRPRGRCSATTSEWRFGAYVDADGRGARRAPRERPEELVAALGGRPVIAHDAKSLGEVPARARPRHRGRRLPARAGAPRLPVPRAVRGARAGDRPSRTRPPPTRVLVHALADWQREEIRGRGLTDLLERGRAAARPDPARDGAGRAASSTPSGWREISARVKDEADALEREIFELAGEEFMLGSPKQLEEILFGKLGLSRKRRGKTGYSTDARVLQAIRDEHAIIPKIERWRELTKLAQTYLDALPLLIDRRRPPAHDLQPDRGDHRAAVVEQPEPAEHPDPHARSGARSAPASSPSPATCWSSADYSQVELRLLAHIAGEDVLKEIFRRGEDVHTATACRVFNVDPGPDRPGHALEVEDDQLRDRLRPVRLRDGRPARHPAGGGRRVHPALHGRASRRSRGSSRRRSSRAPSTATCRRCSAAAARCRSCARGAGSCASRASGSRSTW